MPFILQTSIYLPSSQVNEKLTLNQFPDSDGNHINTV